jgi:archaellum component FlaG (FlaF/FlaG flagellin family)
MKKFFILTAILALAFTSCEEPADNSKDAKKLPSLTIRNESSYDLSEVMFSGIAFSAPGYTGLPKSTQAVKKLSANDMNKVGYITFVRKDIGIELRTEAISVEDKDLTFTFIDTTPVEEVGNSSNKKSLAQINFVSQVAVDHGGLTVTRNDIVNLGEGLVNVPRKIEFIVKNSGVGKLIFDGTEPVRITGDTDSVFSVIQPASSEIAPGGSLAFRINFTPKAIQAYSANVTIRSNDQNGNFAFTITANGVPPKPIATIFDEEDYEIVQNGLLNAGEVLITQSKNIRVTIKNTGSALLTIDTANITITGADADKFTKLSNPSGNISAGNQSSFEIRCEPTREGENNATLRIPTNDESRGTIEIYLRVTAVKGTAILELNQDETLITHNSFTPFNFGGVRVDETKLLAFTIRNTGNIPLELSGSPAVGSSNSLFTITQPQSNSINPGMSTQFLIQFQPAAETTSTSQITIMNNSHVPLFSFTVTGTGTVPKPHVEIHYGLEEIHQDGIIDADEILLTTSKTITVIIKNTGDASLLIDTANISITGVDSSAFNRTTTPGTTVLAGSQTSLNISCTPARPGEHNATLSIPANDASRNPVTIHLKLTGVSGTPILELSVGGETIINNSLTPYDFGRVLLTSNRSATFTIKNTGNIALELTGTPIIESSNSVFIIPSQPLSAPISPGGEVTFAVQYVPESEQTDTGYITILNNSNHMVFTLNLKGTGYTPKPQITISHEDTPVGQYSEFDFGIVEPGGTKGVTFTIGNSGEANLTFVTVGSNRVILEDNTDNAFSVFQQPSAGMIVAPGNTATFTLRFSPTTNEFDYTANVQIITNSEEHDVFSFWVKGRCEQRVYVVGDTGPAGGIVFYDAGAYINGWRYLEASLTDFSAPWGASNVNVSTGSAIGTGKQNTQNIITVLNQAGETGRAAQFCTGLNFNGFTDWFLPSVDELDQMILRRTILNMSGYYWSSTQSGSSVGYAQVRGGGDTTSSKTNSRNVRPIRSF